MVCPYLIPVVTDTLVYSGATMHRIFSRLTKMLQKLNAIATSKTYWLALIFLGIAQEGIALTYQHVWEDLPCVLCIHTRLWIACFILLAIIALCIRKYRLLLAGAHALNTLIMAGLLERSWILLGTERGTVMASCDFDLGLPSWLAVDKWLPAMFEVQATCGYTPELLFGITMAEGLVVMSAALLLISATMTAALFLRKA